ncbi:MAG: heat shock protein HspQ [Gammaproteobacteria bacterium]
MAIASAKFTVGQLVSHKLFTYRGVIVDVDPEYLGSEQWYEQVARSQPPKDRPWYHVLVHDAAHNTYVAERNLEPDPSGAPINHPLITVYFRGMVNGRYVVQVPPN